MADIRLFSYRWCHLNAIAAQAHAAHGGQSLLIGMPAIRVPGRRQLTTYGYLFDQDQTRLIQTARSLGVTRVKVDRPNRPGQHVNLWGMPLARAIARSTNNKEAYE